MLSSYIPIVLLFVVAAGFALALLFAAWGLGPRLPNPEKEMPYECGKDPHTTPRLRFNARFYRVALLFLVFDIEAAFFYPWAVLFRDLSCKAPLEGGVCKAASTPFGLLVMVVFLAVLVLALAFVWRKRALEWD